MALCLALVGSSVRGQVLYRWVNETGEQEISHSVPAEIVHQGYEILDGTSMRVHKVVLPQMDDEEYRLNAERERQMAVCEQALDRVKYLYGSLEDVDAAEAAAERSLELRMQNAQQSLAMARKKLSALEVTAARMERAGEPLGKERLDEIARANSLIAQLGRELTQRELEGRKTVLAYDEERRMLSTGACPKEQPIANR